MKKNNPSTDNLSYGKGGNLRQLGLPLLILILSLLLTGFVNPSADKAKEGNRLYSEGKYDEAVEKYSEALIDTPESPILHYNLGNSTYKMSDYEETGNSYLKTLTTDDPLLKANASYNLGNSKYKEGSLSEGTDPSTAISLYREALGHYQRSIELNTEDTDAKFNYEFVERKIEELSNKENRNQEEGQGEDNQEGNQNQENPNRNEEQTDGERENPEENATPESPGEEERDEGMSREEAAALLDSLKEEESKELLQQRRETGDSSKVKKDW